MAASFDPLCPLLAHVTCTIPYPQSHPPPQTGAAEQPGGELKQLLAAFAGFLLYKWALIGAAVIPDPQLSQALPGGSGKGSKSRVDDRLD